MAQTIFRGNEMKYVKDCITSGWVSANGPYVKKFEDEFAGYCGTKHALSCANGTVALHLALMAYDVGPGDEVLVPDLTYVATANAATYCGARPVFVDCEDQTWNIDPKLIEKKITRRTRGIIVVHLYGHPVDFDPIKKIARRHNLFIIEDAAEAHGARYKKRLVGSLGDIATFSFFGNKIITCGEGGMVVTNRDSLAEKMRLLKGQGMDPKRRYWFPIVGYNYRMTNLQAAVGLAQLEQIGWHSQKRRQVARWYYDCFKDLQDYLVLPIEKSWARHAYWMYTILLKNKVKISRDKFMAELAEAGIETRPVFYPLHLLPPYRKWPGKYPIAEQTAARGLSLPTHALLQQDDIKYIADEAKKICLSHSR